jgi:hypothetical protein
VVRFNYTTYDVWQAQDVVNPNTSHTNIIVLSQDGNVGDGDCQNHKFWYAQVLGIYHVNTVYIGPGMVGYMPRRLDFLWVWWYHYEPARLGALGCTGQKLHQLSFSPMCGDDTFGFLDPADILQSCHIIPVFAKGRRHPNDRHSEGQSVCAGDSKDWNYVISLGLWSWVYICSSQSKSSFSAWASDSERTTDTKFRRHAS